jgi:hypothetical protein
VKRAVEKVGKAEVLSLAHRLKIVTAHYRPRDFHKQIDSPAVETDGGSGGSRYVALVQ